MISLEELKRYPSTTDKSLIAWDASDELIISEFENYSNDISINRVLILNDSFGALTKAFNHLRPTIYTDSFISKKAIQQNNKQDELSIINDLDFLESIYDLIILKVPKNMSFMEDILINLTKHMNKDSKLICSSMVKHLPKSAFDLINKYIGDTTTSLAKKKARLIYSRFVKQEATNRYPLQIDVPEWDESLINHSNLFSREKLDIGTRFFLENIPESTAHMILDLGCANGIIGLKAKQLNPESHIIFSDDSFMAIKSAKANFKKQFSLDDATFLWTNCYEDKSFPKVDIVLCNPPFHQGNTVGDFIARQMFRDSKNALNSNGVIIVIGNRHLGYHVRLKKLFGNLEKITQNKKFVILQSRKVEGSI
jgi:16S rRNA G1207 methylase RsmC